MTRMRKRSTVYISTDLYIMEKLIFGSHLLVGGLLNAHATEGEGERARAS